MLDNTQIIPNLKFTVKLFFKPNVTLTKKSERGLSINTVLRDYVNWNNTAFEAARANNMKYTNVTLSWIEQRQVWNESKKESAFVISRFVCWNCFCNSFFNPRCTLHTMQVWCGKSNENGRRWNMLNRLISQISTNYHNAIQLLLNNPLIWNSMQQVWL